MPTIMIHIVLKGEDSNNSLSQSSLAELSGTIILIKSYDNIYIMLIAAREAEIFQKCPCLYWSPCLMLSKLCCLNISVAPT